MVTVETFNGLRVVIYPNDHNPAHVHIIGPSKEAVFVLNCPDGPPELDRNFGFSSAELKKILLRLSRMLGMLCEEWGKIHGKP